MSTTRIARTGIAAALAAAIAATAVTPSEARTYRRHNDAGAALALGIGAAIIGGIIANKHRKRHRDYYRYDDGPRFYGNSHRRNYYRHGPRVDRHPKERFND